MPVDRKHTPYPSKKRVRFTSPIIVNSDSSDSDSNSVISSSIHPKSNFSAISYDTSITTTPTTSKKSRTYARRSNLEINALMAIIVQQQFDIKDDTMIQVGPVKTSYGSLILKHPNFDVRRLKPPTTPEPAPAPLTASNVSTLNHPPELPTEPSIHYSVHSPTPSTISEDSLSPLDSISNISVHSMKSESNSSVHPGQNESVISLPHTGIEQENNQGFRFHPNFQVPPGIPILSAHELLMYLHPTLNFVLPVNTAYCYLDPFGNHCAMVRIERQD
ncbi:hypothetical protein M231_00904 [Tremella mesenterica]|uniref:Uncharacterized protein n=1 Tax=Tremella mesenterica TaxID=5217 RepID=A0A4Q1BU93_TREME|nr:hypothetical protein M231_00904 [Tremella mesenterica]